MQTVIAALMDAKPNARISAPVLAVFASPHVPDAWIATSTDPAIREAGRSYLEALNKLTVAQIRALANGVPQARVIRLRGAHYIFLSNEKEALGEMRAFLRTLE